MNYVWHCVTRAGRWVWQGFKIQGYMRVAATLPPEQWPVEMKLKARGDDSLAYARWLYSHQDNG